jgi:hypothetical protein
MVTWHDGRAPVLTDDGNIGGWRGWQCAQQWQRQTVRRAEWGETLATVEGEEGNGASAWQLCGDKDVARMWRRWLHGLRVERRWRAVDR